MTRLAKEGLLSSLNRVQVTHHVNLALEGRLLVNYLVMVKRPFYLKRYVNLASKGRILGNHLVMVKKHFLS
jgi:hypothetical protein